MIAAETLNANLYLLWTPNNDGLDNSCPEKTWTRMPQYHTIPENTRDIFKIFKYDIGSWLNLSNMSHSCKSTSPKNKQNIFSFFLIFFSNPEKSSPASGASTSKALASCGQLGANAVATSWAAPWCIWKYLKVSHVQQLSTEALKHWNISKQSKTWCIIRCIIDVWWCIQPFCFGKRIKYLFISTRSRSIWEEMGDDVRLFSFLCLSMLVYGIVYTKQVIYVTSRSSRSCSPWFLTRSKARDPLTPWRLKQTKTD